MFKFNKIIFVLAVFLCSNNIIVCSDNTIVKYSGLSGRSDINLEDEAAMADFYDNLNYGDEDLLRGPDASSENINRAITNFRDEIDAFHQPMQQRRTPETNSYPEFR